MEIKLKERSGYTYTKEPLSKKLSQEKKEKYYKMTKDSNFQENNIYMLNQATKIYKENIYISK
jgi:hypothetical protein